jgi:hypothetical protein
LNAHHARSLPRITNPIRGVSQTPHSLQIYLVVVKGEKMTAQRPEWFELTEKTPATGIRKVDKKLPIAAIAVAGAIMVAGSIFANAGDGPAAIAETRQTLTTSSAATTQPQSASQSDAPAPQISTSPHNLISGKEREGRDHDGERWGDREGRDHYDDRGGGGD